MEEIVNFLQAIVDGSVEVDAKIRYEASKAIMYLQNADEIQMIKGDIGAFTKPYSINGVLQKGVSSFGNYIVTTPSWYINEYKHLEKEVEELRKIQSTFTDSVINASTNIQLKNIRAENNKLKERVLKAEKRYKEAESLLNNQICESLLNNQICEACEDIVNNEQVTVEEIIDSINNTQSTSQQLPSGERSYLGKYKLVKAELNDTKRELKKVNEQKVELVNQIGTVKQQLSDAVIQYREVAAQNEVLQSELSIVQSTIANQKKQLEILNGQVGYSDMKAVCARATKETNRASALKVRREKTDMVRAGVIALAVQGKTYKKYGAEGYELFVGKPVSQSSYYRFTSIETISDIRFVYASYRRYINTYFSEVSLDAVDAFIYKKVKKHSEELGIKSVSDLLKYKNEVGLLNCSPVSDLVYVFNQAMLGCTPERIAYNYKSTFNRELTKSLLTRGMSPSCEKDVNEIFETYLNNPNAFGGRTIDQIAQYIEAHTRANISMCDLEEMFSVMRKKLGK